MKINEREACLGWGKILLWLWEACLQGLLCLWKMGASTMVGRTGLLAHGEGAQFAVVVGIVVALIPYIH